GLQNIVNASAPQVTAPTPIGTSQVNAPTAASLSSPYMDLISANYINPALQSFDYGTQIAQNDMNARQAAGGAFAKNGSDVERGVFDAGTALNRGQLAAQLGQQGLGQAFNLGQSDAANQLTASGQNAANTLNANQFNAGQALSAQIANQQAALQQQTAA